MKTLTILIPTYNEEKNIRNCITSVLNQDFPKDKLQILVIDGNSKDKTREIAKSLGAEVINTDLPNEELKKAYAITKNLTKGEIIGQLDADNIIPNKKDWLKNMMLPFEDPEISYVDTLFFTSRKEDNIITKYGSIIGGDDPISSYLGINDRYCHFTNTWTKAPHKEENKGVYIKVRLEPEKTPALGSNGFFFRKKLFLEVETKHTFIHPVFIYELSKLGYNTMGKVKQGLIHAQNGTYKQFFKKKIRRVKRREDGEINWTYNYNLTKKDFIKTGLYISTIVLPIKDSIVGFIKKPSSAWLFHPVASVSLLFIYAYYILKGVAIPKK